MKLFKKKIKEVAVKGIKTISIVELYTQVDLFLASKGVKPGSGKVTEVMKVSSIALSLNKMLTESTYFDICVVRDAAEILKVDINRDREELLRHYHCVNWKEMGEDTRETIVALTLDIFRDTFLPKEISGWTKSLSELNNN